MKVYLTGGYVFDSLFSCAAVRFGRRWEAAEPVAPPAGLISSRARDMGME